MSKLKCPFCKEEIISDLCFTFNKKDRDYTDGRQIYKCNKCGLFGKKELWQGLIRTHKALDVAIKYIKHTQKVSPFWFNRLANKTLDKIKTTLKQKD